MVTKPLILKINEKKIWYNDSEFVLIEQTNIPHQHLSFPSHRDFYWLVDMTGSERASGKLSINILDYNCQHHSGFSNQDPKWPIKFLQFGKFDWNRLEPLLSMHQKNRFKDQLLADGEDPYKDIRERAARDIQQLKDMEFVPFDDTISERQSSDGVIPENLDFSEVFDVELENCIFSSGYIECGVYIRTFSGTFGLNVYNDSILEEFESVKSWFARKLGKSTFQVVA